MARAAHPLIHTIAVAAQKRCFGVDIGRPYDEVRPSWHQIELVKGLERVYSTDAHCVMYRVDGVAVQPRINKLGLDSVLAIPRRVLVNTILVDADNPGHAGWTPELRELAKEKLLRYGTGGYYFTSGGLRIVQPLDRDVDAEEAEGYIRAVMFRIGECGIQVDWQTRQWNQLMRLPHVHRDGNPYRAEMDLSLMRAISVKPLDEPTAEKKERARDREQTARVRKPIEWKGHSPDGWEEHVTLISRAIREHVLDNYHRLYLCLGGAFFSKRVPPEIIPSLVGAIAASSGSVKPSHHESNARDSMTRVAMGVRHTGRTTLLAEYPAVCAVFDDVMARGAEARIRAEANVDVTRLSLDDATAAIEQAMRSVHDGLEVVSSECGFGKTQAALRVSIERAAKPGRIDVKSALSFPNNDLAIEKFTMLRADGHLALRVFGPLSLKNEDGTPVCIHHEIARPLSNGGQSVHYEFCEGRGNNPCTEYLTCLARLGYEGDEEAKIALGPHALLGQLDEFAGTTGLLFIDEPGDALESVALSEADFVAFDNHHGCFHDDYIATLRPFVEAARAWLGHGPFPVMDVSMALPADARRKAPPIGSQAMARLRRDPRLAEQIGAASKLLYALYRVSEAETPVETRREDDGGLSFTFANERLSEALRRDGCVIAMDATPDTDIFAKIVGYAPKTHHFPVADGAPIRRIRLKTQANRGDLTPRGSPDVDEIATVLAKAFAFLETLAPETVGFITMKLVRLCMDAAMGRDVSREWHKAKQDPLKLDEAVEKLGPLLAPWKDRMVLGHYGAVRGLDTMKHVDVLMTVGDPWKSLQTVARAAMYAGVEPEARRQWELKVELEQAHGRLRTVWRSVPGVAVHVGQEIPGGSGWSNGEVEFLNGNTGRPKRPQTMTKEELESVIDRLGSLTEAARVGRVSIRTMSNYRNGSVAVRSDVAKLLRSRVNKL